MRYRMLELPAEAVEGLRAARRVVVMTGSGLGPACGLPVSPPACRICGARLRPGKHRHEEPAADGVCRLAMAEASRCDIFLCAGASLQTPGAIDIAHAAVAAGARVVQANPNPTPLNRLGVMHIPSLAELALPVLAARACP